MTGVPASRTSSTAAASYRRIAKEQDRVEERVFNRSEWAAASPLPLAGFNLVPRGSGRFVCWFLTGFFLGKP